MRPPLHIFAKAPVRGLVKTRLARDLGDETALAVYRRLLEHTAAVAAAWGPVVVHRTGDATAFAASPLARFPHRAQVAGGLGERLAAGLSPAVVRTPALAIGTDCPGLDIAALEAVADLLADRAAAVGPSPDGGYWCLGVATAEAVTACCAADLPWSRPGLIAATAKRCHAAGIDLAHGPTLADCDDVDDLRAACAAGCDWLRMVDPV